MPDIFDQAAGQTNGDIFDAAAQSATPAPKPQAKPGILDTAKQVVTSHAIQALGGPTLTEMYDKAFPPVEGPGVLRQASEFSRKIARFVPEAIDFTLTPLGAAATAVPVTRLIPPAAMPAVRAGVGAAFMTDMSGAAPALKGDYSQGAIGATREAIKNPSGATIADALKADALTLAPLAHARGEVKKTRALDKQIEAGKQQASDYRAAQEQAVRDEAAAEFAAREDTTPAPKGPKSARDSASVFKQQVPPPVKSAAESADIFDRALSAQEAQAAKPKPAPVEPPLADTLPLPAQRPYNELEATTTPKATPFGVPAARLPKAEAKPVSELAAPAEQKPQVVEPPLAAPAPIEAPKPVAVPAARIARAPEAIEVRPEMPQSKGEFERFVGEEAKPEVPAPANGAGKIGEGAEVPPSNFHVAVQNNGKWSSVSKHPTAEAAADAAAELKRKSPDAVVGVAEKSAPSPLKANGSTAPAPAPQLPRLNPEEMHALHGAESESLGWSNKATRASLAKKGLVLSGEDGTFTPEGKRVAEAVRANMEREREGVPIPEYSPRFAKLPKKPEKNFLDGYATAPVGGKPWFSDGHIAFAGEPEGIAGSAHPDIQRAVDYATKTAKKRIEPVGYFRDGYTPSAQVSVVFSDKTKLDTKYYDYAKRKYPDAEFYSEGDAKSAVLVKSGGKTVGVIMPLRNEDIPEALSKMIGERKPPAARTRSANPEVSAAQSRLKERAKEFVQSESGEQTFTLSTQDFQDLSTVGRDLLSRGAHRVEAWKQQMIDTFGDWVREHLDDVWDAVQRVQRAATPAVTRKGDSGPGFMVRRTGDVVDLADNARHYAMFNLDRELQSGAIRGRGNGIEYKSEEVDPTSLRIAVRRVADKYPEVYVDGPFGSRVYDSAELARNNYSLATTRGKSVAKPSSGERGSFSLKPVEAPAIPKEEEYFNFRRADLSAPEQANLRQEVLRAVDEQGLDPKQVEPHQAILDAAKSIGPEMVKYVQAMPQQGLQTRAARYAMRQRMNTLNREVVEGRDKLASTRDSLSPEDAMKAEGELAQKEADLRNYLGSWAGIRSMDGRNLAMHRMMADSTWDVGFWMNRARRAVGLPPGASLPGAVDGRIRGILVEGQNAEATAKTKLGANASPDAIKADPAVKAARMKMAQEMAKLDESGWWDTLSALRKAGLLTGLKTHLRNIGGNAAFQVMEEVSRIPASIVDMAMSMGTGERAVAGASVHGVVQASRNAATNGFREAAQILRNGSTEADLAKMESRKELNFQKLGKASRVINAYVNGVLRTLSAEDRVFKSFAAQRSIEAQAKVMAMNEVRQGKIPQLQVLRRAQQLAERPTEAMAAQAIADAEFATFNNKNVIAQGISAVKARLSPQARFAMDMVAPFIQTPTNVIARLLEYTPIGSTYEIARTTAKVIADKAMTPEAQKAYSMAVGRGLTGTALIFLGYNLAKSGVATGTGQIDPSQRAVQEAAGRQPGSILVGGQWHRISPFSPAGNLITIGATLEAEASSKPVNIAKIATRTVLEQPMLQGAQEAIEALQDPEKRAEQLLASQAGSFVPTALSDAGTLTDNARRNAGRGSVGQAVKEGIQSRVPVWRNSLPVRRDVLGNPLEAKKSAAVNPLLSSTAKETKDPAFADIVRLKIPISKATRRPGESDEVFDLRSRIRGRVIEGYLREVTGDERYAALPDETKTRALKEAVRVGKDEVSQLFQDDRYRRESPQRQVEILKQVLLKVQ